MKTRIVTSGSSYLDIDGYACTIGYSELLNLQGVRAIAATSAPFNYSISKGILALGKKIEMQKEIPPGLKVDFTIMDVSNPNFFDGIVQDDLVLEVYDHHVGFEDYWHERIGERAKIEFIGCAATLIFEEWEKAGLTQQMSPETAKILVAAILDNTLNFTASVTDARDIMAKEKLCSLAGIDKNWEEGYFTECQEIIEHDLVSAIRKDAKTDCDTPGLPKVIGQITIWDAKKLLLNRASINSALGQWGSNWMLNIICIKDSKGYIVCEDIESQLGLCDIFGIEFENGIATMEKAMLRKELIKTATNYKASLCSTDAIKRD